MAGSKRGLGVVIAALALVGLPELARAESGDDAPPLVVASVDPQARPRTLIAQPAAAPEAASPRAAAPVAAPVADEAALERAAAVEAPPLLAAAPSLDAAAALEAPARTRSSHGHVGLLVGVAGVQQAVHGELVARPIPWLSAGVGVGGIPTSLGDAVLSAASVKGASLSSFSVEGALQVYPFAGSFFLGAAFGHMGLTAAASTAAGPVQIDVSALYLAPRMGWLAVFDSGFSIGLDTGLQLPLSPQVSSSGARQAASNVESLARTLAALPLPTLSLRLGWLL